jgi:hypothetical protein
MKSLDDIFGKEISDDEILGINIFLYLVENHGKSIMARSHDIYGYIQGIARYIFELCFYKFKDNNKDYIEHIKKSENMLESLYKEGIIDFLEINHDFFIILTDYGKHFVLKIKNNKADSITSKILLTYNAKNPGIKTAGDNYTIFDLASYIIQNN